MDMSVSEQENFARMWAWLTSTVQNKALKKAFYSARVIDIPHGLYADFFDNTLRAVGTSPEYEAIRQAPERQELLRRVWDNETSRMYGRLPFDSTFLSFGSKGFILEDSIWKTARLHLPAFADGVDVSSLEQYTYTVLGFLCVRGERVTEVYTLSEGDFGPTRVQLRTSSAQIKEHWTNPFSLVGGVIPAIIDYIHDHRTIVQKAPASFSYRRNFAKAAKKAGV